MQCAKTCYTDVYKRQKQYTATPGEGCTRLPFTKEAREAAEYLKGLMEEAGLEVREDAAGNVIGIMKGEDPSLPCVMMGSQDVYKRQIPDNWAVDEKGNPVTDPNKVNALLPIAGAKGYGLMMMVDIFSGIMTGVPFGKHVSSMYHDCSKGRELGQMHIVMDPERFVGLETFKRNMSATCDELNAMPTADGYDKVYYPGERAQMRKEKAYKTGGIEIVDSIYEDVYKRQV